MTIEEVLKCSPEQLEALSKDDLQKHFEQYLKVTRPEWAPKQTNKKAEPTPPMSIQKRKGLEMLAASGVDLDFLKKRKKK